MNRNRLLASAAAAAALLLGFTGCAGESTGGGESASQSSSTSAESGTAQSNDSKNESSPSAAGIDRSSLHWNDDFPADFPLEDIPMPEHGTFDYAEIIDDGAWNVMLSNVPRADHEAWVAKMESLFKRQEGGLGQINFIGKAASGTAYAVGATIFDEDGDSLTMAYRIS